MPQDREALAQTLNASMRGNRPPTGVGKPGLGEYIPPDWRTEGPPEFTNPLPPWLREMLADPNRKPPPIPPGAIPPGMMQSTPNFNGMMMAPGGPPPNGPPQLTEEQLDVIMGKPTRRTGQGEQILPRSQFDI